MVREQAKTYNRLGYVGVIIFPVLILLAAFLINHIGQPVQQRSASLTAITENISKLIGWHQDLGPVHLKVKTQVGKYRKKFKHLNDFGADVQPFAKRIVKRYSAPQSVARFQQPHFSVTQYSFLHRLAYF